MRPGAGVLMVRLRVVERGVEEAGVAIDSEDATGDARFAEGFGVTATGEEEVILANFFGVVW